MAVLRSQQHGQQQQLLDPTVCAFDTLPEHILTIIAQHLSGGTLENFRQTCTHFRHAANLRVKSIDFHACTSVQDSSAQVPACALASLQDHPNVSRLTIPSSWRHAGILKLLQHMAKLRSSAGGNSGSDHPDNNNSSSSHQAVSASTTSRSTSSSRLLQGAQLDCLELHFQTVCANLCEEIARLAPGVTQLQLSLDLAFELTTKQVSLFSTDMP